MRQAVIQTYKRAPIVPHGPLRAPASSNAKALALALSAYTTSAGRELPSAGEFLVTLPKQLEKLNLFRDGAAWGYHFDTQTRHLFYDRLTPNAIATCFAVGALCDLAVTRGDRQAKELALAARPYLLSLRRTSPEHGPFFAYVASGSELIHNANVVVCAALARLHRLEPDGVAEASVRAAAATTLSRQRSDGLWAYGEAANLGWADNFHTAYTLEGLVEVADTFGLGEDEIALGLRAWKACFFDADGWASYYPNHRFPLEAHCTASAIDLLCRMEARDDQPGHILLADRIARTAIRELWLPELGRFAFRRTRRGLNRREFMRWTNAPMFRALARLASASARSPGG